MKPLKEHKYLRTYEAIVHVKSNIVTPKSIIYFLTEKTITTFLWIFNRKNCQDEFAFSETIHLRI